MAAGGGRDAKGRGSGSTSAFAGPQPAASGLGRIALTRPGLAARERMVSRGLLWPLLAARAGPPPRGRPAPPRWERVVSRSGLDPGTVRRLVTAETEACIEGFPRSANSYAVWAFLAWNPGVRLAHHLHAPFQIRRAARLGIPCCLLVRRPIDAIASATMMDRGRASEAAYCESYIRFHRRVVPMASRVAVCRFEEVTDDPAVVVRRLNERFGTSFRSAPTPPEAEAFFLERIRRVSSERGVSELHAPAPSAGKERYRARLHQRLASHRLLPEAEAAYLALVPDGLERRDRRNEA